jgi:hypothetical protein
MTAQTSAIESSLLMWALSALIVWLAAHVLLGWMRQAQEEWEWDLDRFRKVIIGSATFGTALSVAIPLGLAGEALTFPIGYHALGALAVWGGTMLVVMLLALVPVWREEAASAAFAGVLVGVLMTALQVAWITLAAFRPGIQWDKVFVVAAAVVSAAGTGTAMAIAFPYGGRARTYSYSWRIAAAGLIGLSFLAGYALLLYGADLPTQVGSVYRHDLSSGVISLVGGGLLPIVLLLMVIDLETRRRQRRRQMRSRRRGEPVAMAAELPRYQPRPAPPPAAVPAATAAVAAASVPTPAPELDSTLDGQDAPGAGKPQP